MKKQHKIQWLNIPGFKGETWNPLLGCRKVSDGCKNCYAEKMANRLALIPQSGQYMNVVNTNWNEVKGKITTEGWNGESYAVEESFEKPLRWKKPRVIFVCSMGDLFFNWHSREELDRIFEVIGECQQHIFIILTKRPDRMKSYIEYRKENNLWYGHSWVWLGVTAENQQTANERIPELLKIPAAVRFVSVEPMLEEIDFDRQCSDQCEGECGNPSPYRLLATPYSENEKEPAFIDWVICGGESGPGARPMHPDWARSLRYQCKAAGVPFFFKQWGEWLPWEIDAQPPFMNSQNGQFVDGHSMKIIDPETGDIAKNWDEGWWTIEEGNEHCMFEKVGRKAAGNLLDGERWEEYPALPPDPLKGETSARTTN